MELISYRNVYCIQLGTLHKIQISLTCTILIRNIFSCDVNLTKYEENYTSKQGFGNMTENEFLQKF